MPTACQPPTTRSRSPAVTPARRRCGKLPGAAPVVVCGMTDTPPIPVRQPDRQPVRRLARRLPAVLLPLLLLLPTPGATRGQTEGSTGSSTGSSTGDTSWRALTTVRDSLVAAGPTRVSFTQTYVPAGFSSGEEESGTLFLQLPDCLRWDYVEPYPKIFLLCGDEAWYWNPEDGTGRHYSVDRREEPGLDLVLLGVDQLRQRYRLRQAAPGDGGTAGGELDDPDTLTLHLEPVDPQSQLTSATLVVDRARDRLRELAYTDQEGNRTRFRLAEYRPLAEAATGEDVFQPPRDIPWTEEEL